MSTYSLDKLADTQELDNLIPDSMEEFLEIIDLQPLFHRKLALRALKIKNIDDPWDLLVKTSHEPTNMHLYIDSNELKKLSRLKFHLNSNMFFTQNTKFLDTQMDSLNKELAYELNLQ